MGQQRATPDQIRQLQSLFKEIGPAQSMHTFSQWLSDTQGNYGPQYRDEVSSVVTSLRDAEQKLQSVTITD